MESSSAKSCQPPEVLRATRVWGGDWLLSGLIGIGVTVALMLHAGLGALLLIGYAAIWAALGAALVITTRPEALAPGHRGPGPANRVTLLRAAFTAPLGSLAFVAPGTGEPLLAFWVIGLAGLALLLDGVDGAIARSTGNTTAFGARFDMELDAAMILALSVLTWQMTVVGPWVILIGLMRYAFMLAACPWAWLAGDLPPSRRRQTVCVVQTVVLLLVLIPGLPAFAAITIALAGLLALSLSFAVDIHWLYRHRPEVCHD
ncbi:MULTISPECIES: CDP-alcohol phosphatidyltransferase family protein [unclassified Thioalkalivibrio]|uniref:CDP-alcohol phosphatidyltransferase family protein n=1 Tax=unclassified Thioalkalivibrio TaxID=2621013 RepID=UPI00037FA1B4|nr:MULTISPECIES: CDP-alcohol phosphatidyltransferase family protein [unclassified Thioalkalivibrio]